MNILLVGACGRMGTVVSELVAPSQDRIVSGVDICLKPAPFPIYRTIEEVEERADVIIDFSSPADLERRLAYAAERRLPVVLGATGYSEEDDARIEAYAKRIPVFRSGNLSIGINLMQMLVERAAAVLKDFDAEIIERHHNRKKDAPSGTALMLAESIQRASETEKQLVYGRHGMVGERQPREIGIHAVRGGSIVGEHEVMFAGDDEIITISHSAGSRKIFARGALRAADWLIGRAPGLYRMDDLLSELI